MKKLLITLVLVLISHNAFACRTVSNARIAGVNCIYATNGGVTTYYDCGTGACSGSPASSWNTVFLDSSGESLGWICGASGWETNMFYSKWVDSTTVAGGACKRYLKIDGTATTCGAYDTTACTTPTHCKTNYYWTAGGKCTPCPTGSELKTNYHNLGVASCVYTSCPAGQYLDSGKCYSCASNTGNASATSPGGAGGIESCYITSGSDSTGSFVYEGGCNYTK